MVITFFETGGEKDAFINTFPWEKCDMGKGLKGVWACSQAQALLVDAGVGGVASCASLMGLVLGTGLDFQNAYWLLAGLGGTPSGKMPLGGVVLGSKVVDGDMACQFDQRDVPESWTNGVVPFGSTEPFGKGSFQWDALGSHRPVYHLEGSLLDWAVASVQHLKAIPIQTGGILSMSRLWHGQQLERWACQWMQHIGNTELLASSMEDIGALQALHVLAQWGKVDANRALVLRAIGNLTAPPKGEKALAHLLDAHGNFRFPNAPLALKHLACVGDVLLKGLCQKD